MQQKTVFKLGSKVTSTSYGSGEVVEVAESSCYPVVVKFDDEYMKSSYTLDGRYLTYADVTLFLIEQTTLETVKALIEGKEIEYRREGSDEWSLMSPGFEYRIKPAPPPDTETYQNTYSHNKLGAECSTLESANEAAASSRTAILKITWDGVTNLPKFFEVIDLRDAE